VNFLGFMGQDSNGTRRIGRGDYFYGWWPKTIFQKQFSWETRRTMGGGGDMRKATAEIEDV